MFSLFKPKFKKKVHIIALPKRHTRFRPLSIFNRHRRRYQLFVSVGVVYTIIGGLLGYMVVTNPTPSPARASTPANIVTSIRFLNSPVANKKYNLNDKVSVGLVLQNSSSEDSANEVSIQIQSTSDALQITNIRSLTEKSYNYTILPDEKNISIPGLSAGGQSEYIVDSTLIKNSIENLNIVVNTTYKNHDGKQTGNSNFLTTPIAQLNSDNTSLVFQPMSSNYSEKETVKLTLTDPHLKKNFGKIYLSNRTTLEPVSSSECDFDGNQHTTCEAAFKDLSVGDYSALYISDDEKIMSDISWFSVQGSSKVNFTPSEQTILESPFGKSSINGILPIIARKVISLNQHADVSNPCTFEVYFNNKKINNTQALINEDRNCQTTLDSNNFNQGNGVYQIKLSNFETTLDVSFTEKNKTLFNANIINTISKNKPVDIEVKGLNDSSNQPINGKKAILGLWHIASNTYQEINSLNNQYLSVVDGNISFSIPPSYLDKGGVYQAIIKIEEGTQSEWFGINLADKSVAFAKENISQNSSQTDTAKIKAGEQATFSLGSLFDKDGNQVTSGDCAVSIYTGSLTPVLATGSIDKGLCKTSIKAGRLTKTGPALVSFSAPNTPTSINQSKQIQIFPNTPTTFPTLNIETFPAPSNTANTLIIGPVTDNFGNLADGYNYSIEIFQDDTLVKTIDQITIDHGFARVTIPASSVNGQKLTTRLLSSENKELVKTDFPVTSDSQQFALPALPDSLSSDKAITLETKQANYVENTQCKLRIIRSLERNNELTDDLHKDTNSCNFDWDLQENRDADTLLLQFVIGNQMESKIVAQDSGIANNLFVIAPQLRFTPDDDIDLRLLTSPLIDRQGLTVKSSTIKWKYNGKLRDSQVTNGLTDITLLASDLATKDIQTNNNQRFLNLDFDVKASSSSINKTNNLNIYLGKYDINNHKDELSILSTQNLNTHSTIDISTIKYSVDPTNLEEEQQTVDTNSITLPNLFIFKSPSCSASDTDSLLNTTQLKTHYQAGACFIQISDLSGKHTLSLEQKNFSLLKYDYQISSNVPKVSICENEKGSCVIQISGDQTSSISAKVQDGDRELNDQSSGADNHLTFSHKDLNPLKKYSLEISFKGKDGQLIFLTRELTGQVLSR